MMQMEYLDLGEATVTMSLHKLDSIRESIYALNEEIKDLKRMIKDNFGITADELEAQDRKRRFGKNLF